MTVRGIRGAIVAAEDQPEEILQKTQELLEAISVANPMMNPSDLASIIFTVTDDLTSTYPAKAARIMGWKDVPLICAREIPVPGGLARCIRALLHWNTSLDQAEIHHVYLGEAVSLRPDLNQTID